MYYYCEFNFCYRHFGISLEIKDLRDIVKNGNMLWSTIKVG